MNIQLPQDVLHILNTFTDAGFPAFAVGGCIRDCLRGKTPADWDITTAATPEMMMTLFPKTIPTGIAHGTVTVLINKTGYEVTTFRKDGVYENHRSPESVTFTDDITQDLSRRDFTMNAMAYHPDFGLVDPFGGQEDIKKQLIRCVGDPKVRFDEDALRMLRAIRFASQTGFTICEDILSAIKKLALLICDISAERIRDELLKTLLSDHPEQVMTLHETGLLKLILPEVDCCFDTPQHSKYHCYDVGVHTLKVLKNVPSQPALRLAALLHDIGKPIKKTRGTDGFDHFIGHDVVSFHLAEDILTRLRIDNRTKNEVLHLIRFHDRRMAATKTSVRKAVAVVGKEAFPNLLQLMRADAKGQHPDYLQERLAHYEAVEAIYNDIVAEGDALTIADLAVGGNDLIALGYKGKEIGLLLQKILDFVLEHPEENQKKLLIEKIKLNFFA